MELRDHALEVVTSDSLDTKLSSPTTLTDDHPGEPIRLDAPGRPAGLTPRPAGEVRVPHVEGMTDPHQRPRIVHALANHELQAAELFAWALLAFTDAPADFRAGLARILRDEQRHTRMYVSRLHAAGHELGDFPVTAYFWRKVPEIITPTHFICAMSLTFENANLDHTVEYAEAARRGGDHATAAVIDKVRVDEIEHVRFGWTWLERFKRDDDSMWEAYRSHLTWPLRPAKAKGRVFHRDGRVAAGLDDDFIRNLEDTQA